MKIPIFSKPQQEPQMLRLSNEPPQEPPKPVIEEKPPEPAKVEPPKSIITHEVIMAGLQEIYETLEIVSNNQLHLNNMFLAFAENARDKEPIKKANPK